MKLCCFFATRIKAFFFPPFSSLFNFIRVGFQIALHINTNAEEAQYKNYYKEVNRDVHLTLY